VAKRDTSISCYFVEQRLSFTAALPIGYFNLVKVYSTFSSYV